MVESFLHIRYRVNDLEKTVNFYTQVLGLMETHRHKSPRGSSLFFLKAPLSECLIEICHYPQSGPVQVPPDLTHLAFSVPDLEAFAKHAEAHGYPLTEEPTRASFGNLIAFIDARKVMKSSLFNLDHETRSNRSLHPCC